MLSLFTRAVAAGERRNDATGGGVAAPEGPAPVTAAGWLDLAATQQPAGALVSIRQALALQPTWVLARERLCEILSKLEDPDAVDACDAMVGAHPGVGRWLGLRAIARLRAGQLDAARRDLDQLVAQDPDPRWLMVRSEAHHRRGDPAAARVDRDRACAAGVTEACPAGGAGAP